MQLHLDLLSHPILITKRRFWCDNVPLIVYVYVRTQYVRLEWSILVRSLVLTITKRTWQYMWLCPNLKICSLQPARLCWLVLTISNIES